MPVHTYHQQISKKYRIIKEDKYVMKHVCIEKDHFLRCDGPVKALKTADHLFPDLHISRRREGVDNVFYIVVTDCVPHTCTSNITTIP